MDEQRIVELLTRKIAGEATQEELGELSYLLTKNPDALYYEALLEQVWNMGKDNENADLEQVFDKHKVRFQEELNFTEKRKPLSFYIRKPVFALATIAFILLAYLAAFYKKEPGDQTIEIVANKGIRKEIKLPDGTLVQLNSDSKLSYSTDMLDQDERNVSLTGEAFFKVAHDKKHPFIVKTNKIAIKVLGTEFNIKDYPGDRESETTLLKGSIELTVNGRSEQKFILKPTEKFAVSKKSENPADDTSNSVLMIDNISPVKFGDKEYIQEISWIENKFVFENESFEDLLPKLERWYNVRIVLNDPAIKSYRFTGIFINENITQALEAMQLIKPFNYKQKENEVKIY
jgi:transmembrane sensor